MSRHLRGHDGQCIVCGIGGDGQGPCISIEGGREMLLSKLEEAIKEAVGDEWIKKTSATEDESMTKALSLITVIEALDTCVDRLEEEFGELDGLLTPVLRRVDVETSVTRGVDTEAMSPLMARGVQVIKRLQALVTRVEILRSRVEL